MRIKISIKPNSKTAHAFKKYMAEKAAFKHAVQQGTVDAYVKQNGKFATPITTKQ